MKIYVQDHDWAGCIIAVANSEKEAREIMEKKGGRNSNYNPEKPLEEHEIVNFFYENLGDS